MDQWVLLAPEKGYSLPHILMVDLPALTSSLTSPLTAFVFLSVNGSRCIVVQADTYKRLVDAAQPMLRKALKGVRLFPLPHSGEISFFMKRLEEEVAKLLGA